MFNIHSSSRFARKSVFFPGSYISISLKDFIPFLPPEPAHSVFSIKYTLEKFSISTKKTPNSWKRKLFCSFEFWNKSNLIKNSFDIFIFTLINRTFGFRNNYCCCWFFFGFMLKTEFFYFILFLYAWNFCFLDCITSSKRTTNFVISRRRCRRR